VSYGSDLIRTLRRHGHRAIGLRLLLAGAGLAGFVVELRPTPHWAWDAFFVIIAVLSFSAALLLWINLQADLRESPVVVPCYLLRVDEGLPGHMTLEVQVRHGRLRLWDLRAERDPALVGGWMRLTYARHLAWALHLEPWPGNRAPFPHSSADAGPGTAT
jgi:hypothetical protein